MVQFVLKLITAASPKPGAFTKCDLLVRDDIKHWKQEEKKRILQFWTCPKIRPTCLQKSSKFKFWQKRKKIMKMYENSQNFFFKPKNTNKITQIHEAKITLRDMDFLVVIYEHFPDSLIHSMRSWKNIFTK